MIKVFAPTDKTYTTNGDIVIQPFKAKVHKADNGTYHLELEAGIEYTNYLQSNNIIVADTPQGAQAFRIKNPEYNQNKIVLKAYHVFFDSQNYLIADSYVVNKTCNDALDHLNSATDNTSPFTTLSNITNTNSYRCVRTSLYEAINTILDRWGGHLVRDNWDIKIMSTIGQDNGVTIRYAKNLEEITCTYNWDNVVTKLLPVGTDGVLLDALDETQDIYMYSDFVYDIPFTKTVSFEQDINEEDFQDEEGNTDETAYKQALIDNLIVQAQEYLDANCVPQVNYTLKADIDKITDVGDIIEVIDERLGINVITNVISFEYDCILEKYTQIEFGNFEKKLSGLLDTITATTNEAIQEATTTANVTLQNDLQNATSEIWGVMSDSYVIYTGDKILVVDALPMEDATNCLLINNGGIGFSTTGINGTFNSAWTIDGTLNMQAINVINLTADLIKGGTLKLGSNLNQYGQLEVYDESNALIAQLDKNGLKMYGVDGSYILINNEVGLCGYDRLGNQIYWVSQDEFHMKKSVVEEEITLFNKLRFIPITLETSGNVTSDGMGLVSVLETDGAQVVTN